jgi:hypothetical protein
VKPIYIGASDRNSRVVSTRQQQNLTEGAVIASPGTRLADCDRYLFGSPTVLRVIHQIRPHRRQGIHLFRLQKRIAKATDRLVHGITSVDHQHGLEVTHNRLPDPHLTNGAARGVTS